MENENGITQELQSAVNEVYMHPYIIAYCLKSHTYTASTQRAVQAQRC
jgi:hypothetical protein